MKLKDKIRQWLSIDELNEDFINQTVIIEKQIADLERKIKALQDINEQHKAPYRYYKKETKPDNRKKQSGDKRP